MKLLGYGHAAVINRRPGNVYAVARDGAIYPGLQAAVIGGTSLLVIDTENFAPHR